VGGREALTATEEEESMRMTRAFLCACFPVLTACATTDASTPDREGAQAQFKMLCSLEGDWITPPGFDAQRFVTSFRVTCNGSVVEETLFKGTPREVISMYCLDGERLMQTHYSICESQTRMVARDGGQPGEIAFEFMDATAQAARGRLPVGSDHMYSMRMLIKDHDHVEEWWQIWIHGELYKEFDGHVELTRQPARSPAHQSSSGG
jgi:hypothetical protein